MNPTQICVYTSVGVVYTNWCFVYTQKCHQWTLEYGVPPGGSHQRGSAMAEDQESAPLHAADIKGTVEMPPALRPPTLASGQMSRDGSVPAAAGARRGDGQTAPAPRGRLASSIGCVSHHRMVWMDGQPVRPLAGGLTRLHGQIRPRPKGQRRRLPSYPWRHLECRALSENARTLRAQGVSNQQESFWRTTGHHPQAASAAQASLRAPRLTRGLLCISLPVFVCARRPGFSTPRRAWSSSSPTANFKGLCSTRRTLSIMIMGPCGR